MRGKPVRRKRTRRTATAWPCRTCSSTTCSTMASCRSHRTARTWSRSPHACSGHWARSARRATPPCATRRAATPARYWRGPNGRSTSRRTSPRRGGAMPAVTRTGLRASWQSRPSRNNTVGLVLMMRLITEKHAPDADRPGCRTTCVLPFSQAWPIHTTMVPRVAGKGHPLALPAAVRTATSHRRRRPGASARRRRACRVRATLQARTGGGPPPVARGARRRA